MVDFKCNRNNMTIIKSSMQEINDVLTSTYNQAVTLAESMDDTANWDGEAHKVAMAFLNLTMQYHALLTESGKAPVKQAYEDLVKYLEVDDVFYDEWENYQKLLEV